jgi:hypothetical protein
VSDEDLLNGLYIHERSEGNPTGTRVLTTVVDGTTERWVDAADFMAVQKERDDARRQLAFVNAWRWSEAMVRRDFGMLDAVLANAGLTRELGRATLGIMRELGGCRL